jgi:hypothetical protein
MKKLIAGMVCLLFGTIGVLITSTLIKGVVLSKLWQWFVVSSFGLPPMSIAVAIGISMIVSYLTVTKLPKDENPSGATSTQIANKFFGFSIFYPLMVLFFGWIVHFFV